MYKFLRISSIYPGFLKKIKTDQNLKNLKYEDALEIIFKKKYSVSNFISLELKKKNYECFEIISNANFIQNKWMDQYGDKKLDEDILLQQIKFYKPNIVYIGNINLINEKLIFEIKKMKHIKLLIAFHCAPFTKKLINSLKNVDLVVTCTYGYQKMLLEKLDKKVLLMKHAFYKDNNTNSNLKNRDINLTFIGSIFINKGLHFDRIELVYELMKNFKNSYIAINFSNLFFLQFINLILKSIFNFNILKKIKIFYKLIYIYCFCKKPVFGIDMYKILKKTKILINTHIEDTKFAGNMRLFEGTGSGCLVITDNKKGLENLFVKKDEIEVFYDIEDLIKKIKYYLCNTEILTKVATNGMNQTISSHNYSQRISELDEFIKENI